ncbi:MarR family winged helix-turn-helix transcriptional regulator [Glutamicibacter uratoxydans]|uniref:MarR family winged helix-turn-helix transcriptional regulator n=1 Tax=Glutamicibacter uratoxydans TaxID=43667 RepID=UPI003D6FA54A
MGPVKNPDELLKLESQVCFGVAVASREVISAYRPVLEPLGLTHPQYLVMLALWEHAPIGARELSSLLHLDPGTLSPLLKRLESRELVTRRKNPEDERAILIELTADGAKLREQALQVPVQMMQRLELDEQDVRDIQRLMGKLATAASKSRG